MRSQLWKAATAAGLIAAAVVVGVAFSSDKAADPAASGLRIRGGVVPFDAPSKAPAAIDGAPLSERRLISNQANITIFDLARWLLNSDQSKWETCGETVPDITVILETNDREWELTNVPSEPSAAGKPRFVQRLGPAANPRRVSIAPKGEGFARTLSESLERVGMKCRVDDRSQLVYITDDRLATDPNWPLNREVVDCPRKLTCEQACDLLVAKYGWDDGGPMLSGGYSPYPEVKDRVIELPPEGPVTVRELVAALHVHVHAMQTAQLGKGDITYTVFSVDRAADGSLKWNAGRF